MMKDGSRDRCKDYGFSADMSWRMKLGQRGWLRPTVLKILEQGPMNGIEIMNSIHDMSHGWWRPSPGSIYPLLESLSAEKMIKKREDGKYGLSASHRGAYGPVSDSDEIMTNMEGDLSYLEELSKSDRKAFAEYKSRIAKMAARLSRLR
jgi:hypothetical protein